jgi:hypothetical protein
MKYPMTIEQTVEIPVDHRLYIDVPPYIPEGKATITFSIAPANSKGASQSAKTWRSFRGIFKGSGGTVSDFLKRMRADRELEDEIEKRRQTRKGG